MLTAGVRSSFRLLSRDEYGNVRLPTAGIALALEARRASDGCETYLKLSIAPEGTQSSAGPTFVEKGQYLIGASTLTGGGGNGLLGVYFSDEALLDPVASRVDPQVSFDWGASAATPELVAGASFGVRWSGFITAATTGEYTFSTVSDSGASLSVGGVLLISYTGGLGAQLASPFLMTAGIRYPIELEYNSRSQPAFIQLRWASPPQVHFPAF